MQKNTAVILMAYGSPESLADIPAYLCNVRSGRQPSQDLLERVTARYERIGGRSPLLLITQSIAQKLEKVLNIPVYIGMLHWHPYLEDTAQKILEDGIQHVVAIPLTPYFSDLSVGKYHKRLMDTLHGAPEGVELHFVKSWHDQSDYVAGLAANIQKGRERFPPQERDQIQVIFTAHSLPVTPQSGGDTYQKQLQDTALSLAERLSIPRDRWTLAYQSAPRADSTWLGPHLEGLVKKAAGIGKRPLLIAPIGFITDHLEILYDIDVKMMNLAKSQGIKLQRMDMLNDSPALIAALEDLVTQQLKP